MQVDYYPQRFGLPAKVSVHNAVLEADLGFVASDVSDVATRGSASSKAMTAVLLNSFAASRGEDPHCGRRGTGCREKDWDTPPIEIPYQSPGQRVHSWLCEEESDDREVTPRSRRMKRRLAVLKARSY